MMGDIDEIKKLLRDIRNAVENGKESTISDAGLCVIILFLILLQVCGIASKVG